MADLAAWPTAGMRNVLISGKNLQQFTAGAIIKAGQVVAFHGTGVSWTVHPAVTGTTGTVVGVALYDVASGAQVTVACRGCQAYVQNGAQGAVDAGDILLAYGTTTAGTVSVADIATGSVTPKPMVGYALEDHSAADGAIAIEVSPGYITKS